MVYAGAHPSKKFNRDRMDKLMNGQNGKIGGNVSKLVVNDVLSLLVFTPPVLKDSCPVFYFVHGGGFCIGEPENKIHFDLMNEFASKGYIVVSPAYRLAPEHPFPSQVIDCFDGLRYIASGKLAGADISKIVVGGDSAGGNLALIIASLVRDGVNGQLEDEQLNISIRHIVAMYPAMMLPFKTKSQTKLNNAAYLPYWFSRWFNDSYLPDEMTRQTLFDSDRRVCPLTAGVHGLPSVTVIFGSHDPFHDECEMLCRELQRAGGTVHKIFVKNQVHGFLVGFKHTAKNKCLKEVISNMELSLDDTGPESSVEIVLNSPVEKIE